MAISITGFSADRITTTVGQTVKFTAAFDGNVSLIRTASQTPFLALSNGGLAYFDSVATGNATDQLVFSYTVANSDNTMANLQVNGLFLDGASLVDASSQTVDTTVTRGDNSQIVLTGTSDSVSIIGQSIVSNDLIAPKVSSVEAVSGNYKVGDKVTVSVVFDEAVGVTPGAQLPTLSFTSNGEVLTDVIGSYVSGSGTKKLNFTFTVTETMDIADLEVGALNVNGSVLADASGNVVSNNNGSIALPVLPSTVAISLGDQSETVVTTPVSQDAISIESIRYLSDDTDAFKVGDVLDFSVRMTGVTTVDTSEGVPTLVLGNGGLATYVSGSGSNTLTFRYIVSSQDRNTTDLKVLGVAENDGLFLGSAGQLADVRISATNNLSLFNDVKINAQSPYITRIDSTSDTLGLGDSVEFMVNFSEAVELSGDAPTLTLSNGATATYVSGSTSNVLLFRYTASEGDADSADLDVTGFDAPNSTLMSLAGHGEASLSLAKAASVASKYAIEVDSTRPEGVITFESTQLIAGESTGVTITFTESVSNPHAAITVSNGTLSALVAVEGTASERTVWKGTFTPTAGIESSDTTLVLDNSLVKDDAGNTGNGISVSAPLSIDTLGPVVSMSNEVLFNGNRLITIDLGETVTDFSVDDIVVSNGIKVTSGFSEVEANRIYTLEVSPSGNGAVGDLKVTLRKGSVSDALGNVNAEQSFTTGWDIKAPEIESISATNGTFTVGDTLSIAVRYDEVVNVDTTKGVPFLALNNGAKAEYVRGSESDTLVFEYVIQAGDYADHLDVMAMVKDSGVIEDNSGNAARTMISAGMNLGDMSSVEIDGVAPSIVTMTAESGLYLAGDTATITVQFSEAITVDESQGSPILALSNGSIAQYTGGSGSHYLTFTYEVQANDFDTTDLDVHALIENGSTLQDAAGNDANLVLQSALNHLSYRSDVVVDAATPYINTISANAGYYKAGDTIDIALGWNKPVVMDDALGTPEIKLSNGAVVALNSAMSSVNKLVFSYTLTENDIETTANAPLSVAEFRPNYATFKGVVAGVPAANLSGLDAVEAVDLPNLGAIAQDQGGIQIDMSGPSVASLTVLGADDGLASFKAGEAATVTLTFSEAVKEVLPAYFAIENGKLGAFSTDDNITWTATFVPTRDTDAGEQSLSLDLSKIADMAGNYGAGQSVAASYTLDSEYPTVTLRSDVVGVTNEEVRIVVNFSETVENFDLTKISVLNGTVDANSLETPDNSGRPEGEYSFIVIPDANSTQPIKVRVMDGVVTDLAGNANKQSEVLVQPVDTVQAKIESIQTEAGAYAVGDTVRLEVNFSEAVELHDDPTDPTSDRVPTLFLNNGELATYVSGSGSDTWVFEYTYAADDATSSRPLQVLSFLENDKLVLDTAGNRTHTVLNSSNRLKETVIVDGEGPVVAGFSAIEANYNSSEASESGVYNIGDVVWIKLNTSEWVSVDSAAGRPTLELANGGSASYVSGSGSDTLLFRYVVQDADASTEALSVSSITMNGGSIVDVAGNALDISTLTSDSVLGIAKSTQAVVVDADAPIVELVTLVEDAGTNTDVTNDGYYKAGTTLAFDVSFDDALIVDTTDGAPVLTLSNGQLAEYVLDKSDLANGVMRFEYTVLADDINTIDLKVLGLAEQGAVITDDAGNAALVEMVTDRRNYTTAVIDTKAPELFTTADSFTENERGEDLVRSLETVTYSFTFDGMMDFILAGDTSLDPRDTDAINALIAAKQDEILALFDLALESRADDTWLRTGFNSDGDEVELTGSELTADIVKSNFRFAVDQEGNLDLTTFSIDVETPDRTYADLVVSIDSAQVGDFAQNITSATDFSHRQAVDTQSVSIITTPTAGLFVGAESTVRALDLNGDELGTAVTLDPTTGRATIDILPSGAYPGGYRGPVIVEVIDNDPNPDYIDEYTGEPVTLSDGTTAFVMRAMFNVTEPGDVSVTVSPVTELAVTKLKESMANGEALDAAKVEQYNAGIAKIFGLGDIVTTAVTVVNSARVESEMGVDVADFNSADGIDASEKYGQVLAMLSARDTQTGSLGATLDELAGQIKAITSGSVTQLAIKQAGADQLVEALTVSEADVALDQSGVNRGLLDVAYIEEAAASGYGLNLAEAETATVPVKGAQLGDTVVVQWGTIQNADLLADGESLGDANTFTVVITEADIDADGNVRVPVPLSVIEKQGDATEVAVRNAIIPVGATNEDGSPKTEVTEDDYQAPVLLAVDIVPPEVTASAPTAAAPHLVTGLVTGMNAGDDLNVLLNNSDDPSYKYSLSTDFLDVYQSAYTTAKAGGQSDADATVAGQSAISSLLPAGLSVSNISRDLITDTFTFEWSLDITQAISVAQEGLDNPQPTFSSITQRVVSQVDVGASDIVGNNSNNSVVVDIVPPDAPILVLGAGVSDGATAAEATAAEGILTVQGEEHATITVIFTSGSNSVTKTLTGTGSAQAVQLTADELSTLGEGAITVTASQTDEAGNASPETTQNITIDTIAPSAPTITAVADGDNGAFDQGFTVTEGSDVVVKVDGTELDTTALAAKFTKSTASGVDTYTAVSDAFAGNETITVDATLSDAAGNQSAAATQVTLQAIDTTAPSAPTITAVADGDNSAFDEGFTVTEGSDVVVTVDSTALDATALAAKFTKTTADGLDTYTAVSDAFAGNETITVDATLSDAAGNQSAAATQVALQAIDTTAPSVPTITAVADGDNSAFDEGFTVTEGSDVVVTVDGAALDATALAAKFTKTTADGVDTYTAVSDAFAGNETIKVDATLSDAAGNQSAAATQVTLQAVDTTAPSAPTINTVATDDVINSAEQDSAITGTAEANATVTLTLGTGNTRTVTADSNGDWSYTLVAEDITAMGEGAETISVTASDAAGNTGTAATRDITIDTTAPSAPTINTVATDDVINSAEQSSAITGTAEANATVTLTLGTGNTRTVTADSNGDWSYTLVAEDITAMGEGAETISVTASDAAGNTGTAATRDITIDTTAPSAPTINTVATDDVINSAEQDSAITGTAEANATVTLTLGTGNTRTVTADSNGDWSYTLVAEDITAMGEGAETISVTASDAAGNTGTAATRDITIDTTAPSAPTINTVATDDVINSAEQGSAITGTAEANATVTLTLGTGNTRTVTADSNGDWSYTLVAEDITAMGEGAETISVTASDAAGNTGTAATRDITIDTTAPSAPTINTVATDDVINSAEQDSAITGTAEANATVTLTLGTGNTRTVTADSNGDWSYTLVAEDITAMGEGAETISVTASDAAGNTGTAATRDITIDTTAPSAPTINTVATDDVINSAEQGSAITGTAEANATVTLTLGTGNTRTVTADSNGDWSYTLVAEDITAMGEGAETISVTASDAAGNTGTAATRNITIDTITPTPSLTAATDDVGSVTGALSSGNSTDDTSLALSGTCEVGSTVEVFDGSTSLGAAVVIGTTWSYTATVDDGTTYQFNVKETDVAGNISAATADFTVIGDTTAPTMDSLVVSATRGGSSITDGSTLIAGDVVTVTATYSEAVTGTPTAPTLTIGSETGIALTAGTTSGNTRTWTYTIDASGTADSGSLSLVGGGYLSGMTDVAGNAVTGGAATASGTFTVDSIAPTANFAQPIDDVGSVTGALNSGNSTDDTSLALSGTCEVGSTVEVFDGSTSLGAAAVSGTTWSYTATVDDGTTYQFNVKETDVAGNISAATADFTVIGDTTAPTAILTAASVANTGNATVQSNEVGTAYLVKDSVIVNSLTDITGAADDVWNSVVVNTVDSDTALSATGLIEGNYKLYAVDAAGNLSAVSTANVNVDSTAPTMDSLVVSATRGGSSITDGSTLIAGDVVTVTATYSEAVTGTPTAPTLTIGSETGIALTAGTTSGNTRTWTYTIDASGTADSGSLSLVGGGYLSGMTDVAGNAVTGGAATASGTFTVDGTVPAIDAISIPNVTMKVGDVVTATLTVSGAAGETLTLASGSPSTIAGFTLGNLIKTNDTTYTATFTVTEGGTDVPAGSDIPVSVQLTDAAGNLSNSFNTAISQAADLIDANSPASTIVLGNIAMAQLEATTNTSGTNYEPQIAAVGSNGEYVVTWSWLGQDSDNNWDYSIFVQKFNADGTTTGQTMVQLKAVNVSGLSDREPQIAALGSSGEFVVTWSGQDSDNGDYSIFVQKFNADGTTTGQTMVQLEAIGMTTSHDEDPQITAVGSGEYVVTWDGWENGNSDISIFVQKFNSDGTTTDQTPVKLEAIGRTDKSDWYPQITSVGSSGEFVVTWYGLDSDNPGDYSIFVQKFNSDGTTTNQTPVQLEAISVTDKSDESPQITEVGTEGEFVVTWSGRDSNNGDFSIFVQKFNANGTTTGSTVQLEAIDKTDGIDTSPQIAALGSSGEFVVTWSGQDSDNRSYSIFVQKFNSDGTTTHQTPVKLEAIGTTNKSDKAPQITAVGSSGEFVVTWYGVDSEGDDSIFVQKFNSDGTTTNQAPVQLEAIGIPNRSDDSPQIAAVGSNGEFAVTWKGEESDGDFSIFVQKFAADGSINDNSPMFNTESIDVKSSQVGTAYLVNESVTVSSLADITGAADHYWNSIAIPTANTNTTLALSGLIDGNYKLYTLDEVGNLSVASSQSVTVAGTRSVTVSNITLRDNDDDYTNGTVYDVQALSADIAGLSASDSVYLTVGSASPIDVTDFVNNGKLDYGVQRASATLTRGTAIDGFYQYDLAVDFVGSTQPNMNFGLYIPDETKLRNGQATELNFDTIEFQGNSAFLVQMSVDGIQAGDQVDFQSNISLTLEDWGGWGLVGSDFYDYDWDFPTSNSIEFYYVSPSPTGAVTLATITGTSGKIYEILLDDGVGAQLKALDEGDDVASVAISHLYTDIQPVNGVYELVTGSCDTFTAKVYGTDGELYAISKTPGSYAVIPTLIVDEDSVRSLDTDGTFDLIVDLPARTGTLALMSGATKLDDFVDTRFNVVDGDLLTITVKDSASTDITAASGNTITVDINIPAPSLKTLSVYTSNGSDVLDVGDTLNLVGTLDFGISATSATSFELVLSNGGIALMSLVQQDTSRKTFTGSYTVAEGDATTQDLQVTSIRAISGSSLPSNDTGSLQTGGSVPSLSYYGYPIEVTDVIPLSIDSIQLATDTGLYADDNVTSVAFQYDANNGAVSGGVSPTLTDDDSFAVVVKGEANVNGMTKLEWESSNPLSGTIYDVTSVSGDGALDTFKTVPDFGLYLSKPNRITLAGSESSIATAGDTLSVSFTVDGGSPVTITHTATQYTLTAEDILYAILSDTTNQAILRAAGYDFGGQGSDRDPNDSNVWLQSREIIRKDGLAFTIDFSDKFNGAVYFYERWGTYTATLSTGNSYTVDMGGLDAEGSLTASLYNVNKASVDSLGSDTTAAQQTLDLTLNDQSFDQVLRLGDIMLGNLNSSHHVTSWDGSTGLIAYLNSLVSQATSGNSVPTILLGDNSDAFGQDATAKLEFVWASFTDFEIASTNTADNVVNITLKANEEADVQLSFTESGSSTIIDGVFIGAASEVLALNNQLPDGSPYRFIEIDTNMNSGIRLLRTDGKAFTVDGLDGITSSTPAAASISVSDNFGAVDYVVSSFKNVNALGQDSFDYTLDRTAATTPIVADTDSNTSDGTLTVTGGTDISAAITGVAAGDYVYLVESSQSAVLDNLTSAPQTALDNLRGLSDELWSRSKVASDNSVDLTTAGLADGDYKVVAMDLAGNFSVVATNTVTVTGSTYSGSDTYYDVMFAGIDADATAGAEFTFSDSNSPADNTSNNDSTAKLVLNTGDASEGDTVELWADGQNVFSTELTTTNISEGQLTIDEINFTSADGGATTTGTTANDEKVLLEVKVKHGDQYVQDSGDVTWEYQW